MTESQALEDIETLLDQVERKYIKESGGKKPLPIKKAAVKDCPCNAKTETNWDEVDELLRDFRFEDTNPFGKQNNKSWVRPEVKEDEGEKRDVKCFPVYLAGSFEVMGLSEVGEEKPCDQLKCVRCDFNVLHFDNYAWDSSTDYLFLRNNMPEFEKLEKKLHKQRGTRAYACQCQHLCITKITNTNAIPQLRWICGKHSAPDKSVQSTKFTQRY